MQERWNREDQCREDISSASACGRIAGDITAGWFITRLGFTFAMTYINVLGIRSGVSVVAGSAMISMLVVAVLFRDIARTAMAPSPRFVVTAKGAVSSLGLFERTKCLPRSEIREVELFTSRGVLSILAVDGERLNLPWRWVRLGSREKPDLLSAGLEIRDLLDVPATEVRGLNKGRETRIPL